MLYRSVSLISLVALTACGGSGGSPTVAPTVPLADTGFASDTSDFDTATTFSLPGTTSLIGDADGELSFAQQDIVLSQIEDSDDINVTIDGVTERLSFISNVDGIATFGLTDNDLRIEISNKFPTTPNASILEFFVLDEGALISSGDFVIGLDTNPETLGEMNGTAEFDGELFITARSGFDASFGTGTVELDVNFDDRTIGGAILVEANTASSNDFDFPTASFEITETDITGNGFSTTFTQAAGDIGGDLTSAAIDGRFFGSEAEDIGGHVSAIVDDGDTVTHVIGGYIASQ